MSDIKFAFRRMLKHPGFTAPAVLFLIAAEGSRLAERRRFRFVVLFIHQDYDALWDTIKSTAPELFIAWRDCGLIDERGRSRPAFAVWREYFSRPFGDVPEKP